MRDEFETPSDNVIRITTEDAMSEHVDDLLKRQASLRGDQGITANRKKRWFYSNWFVFALAGGLAGLVVIAIFEPYFDDALYVQGKVENVTSFGELAVENIAGIIEIKGQMIFVPFHVLVLNEDESVEPFDISTISVGDEIAIHVQQVPVGDGEDMETQNIASFIEPVPLRDVPNKSFEQLVKESQGINFLIFPCIAAAIGLAIGSVDGLVCRQFRRVVVGGTVGTLVGFIGGAVAGSVASLLYGLIYITFLRDQMQGGEETSTMAFVTQMTSRGLAWCLAGMAMGLGQGIALRSGRLLLYGFLGGVIGGLLGGLLFDPIYYFVVGEDNPSAHLSRFIGFTTVGLFVGLMIGVVELLARDAWLQMVAGPLAGKEFLIFKDTMKVGASPRSDIYLFNDESVSQNHAVIRATSDQYELEATSPEEFPVLVNGQPTKLRRLRHGDQIKLGSTVFSFQRRKTE